MFKPGDLLRSNIAEGTTKVIKVDDKKITISSSIFEFDYWFIRQYYSHASKLDKLLYG